MPAVWDSKVTFVCFSILGVSLVLSLWICLWTLWKSVLLSHLGEEKKRGGRKQRIQKEKKR